MIANRDLFLQRCSLPLDAKIQMTTQRIKAWHEHFDGDVYVSFSGGRDSTVLLHLVWSIFPRTATVFVNTGIEYPENVAFVKTFGDRVTWLRPQMTFADVIAKYGYPVISKRVSQYVAEVRASVTESASKKLRLTGIRSDGSYLPMAMIPKKWQFLCEADFSVSDQCCDVMKKRPALIYHRATGLHPILGTRAAESEQRMQTYYRTGCNAYNLKVPRSTPLAFWTEEDITQYIVENKLTYSSAYDPPLCAKRTGCVLCGFGCHLDPSPTRFQKLAITHPKLWDFGINRLGMGRVLEAIGVAYKPIAGFFGGR